MDNQALKKILLADDDEALLKLYEVEFKSKGFVVMTAKNGDECLQRVAAEMPDVILLDVMMPNKDGVATLRALKENETTAKIPVLMLTNFGQEDLIKNAMQLGANDYLLKYRVTPNEMSEKVTLLLNPAKIQL